MQLALVGFHARILMPALLQPTSSPVAQMASAATPTQRGAILAPVPAIAYMVSFELNILPDCALLPSDVHTDVHIPLAWTCS